MHCESTQLANSSQNVTANQANLTEALQFVQAEQREMLGSHQTVECWQNEGNSALQQLSMTQVGENFSEQVSYLW